MYAETGVSVRRAMKEDVEQLAELVYRFYSFNEEFDPTWAAVSDLRERSKAHAEAIVEDQGSIVLVAVQGLEVIGYLRAEVEVDDLLVNSKQFVIKELYVKPEQRRQGVATLLINKAKDEARKAGASIMLVEFPAGNKIAEDLYSKMSFRPYSVKFVSEV